MFTFDVSFDGKYKHTRHSLLSFLTNLHGVTYQETVVLENTLRLPLIHLPERSLSHIPRDYMNRWLHKAPEQQLKFPFVDFELGPNNFSCT
jgi:hypothetical protein